MKNLIIIGASGVGKTFLEMELEKLGWCNRIPVYSNRPSRVSDNSKSIVCLNEGDFEKVKNELAFCRKYCGYDYGWKGKDLKKNPISIVISMGDAMFFLKKHSDFLPILLEVDLNDLPMLKERMEKRGDSPGSIGLRLLKTKEELKNMDMYRKNVLKHGGLIFHIKNDRTIFEEVIPALAKIKN